MKRLALPLFAALALCGAGPALSRPGVPAGYDPGPVHLSVLDREDGQSLPQYRDGAQRWIAGQQGHRYSVRLRNGSAERVLVVLSVDGLNAISGEVAAPGQTGYVLDPWQTADISGWRKSAQEVAQFVFTDPGRSYAARTGRPDNIGVIGIAVFAEAGGWSRELEPKVARSSGSRLRGQAQDQVEAQADAGPLAERVAPTGRSAPAAAPRLGTGHGQREASAVRDTTFERASSVPMQRWDVRYDSERALRARGIIPRVRPRLDDGPQAFPQQYAPDPPPLRRY